MGSWFSRERSSPETENSEMHSILKDCDGDIDELAEYEFPFENLVLEGGGNKGIAYCGALAVLKEVGILENINRIAGASAGAIMATLLAVGFTTDEIKEVVSQDQRKLFLDHSCGYCSLLPNIITKYGWNPGKRFYKILGELLKKKTGSPDITFNELYQKFGKELCIVVTNLNQKCPEYLHPKTMPNMPVRIAVRMSISIPGIFAAKKFSSFGHNNLYVDGGMLINYPIHCFDGWWLSMAPDDSFFLKLQPLSDLPLFHQKDRRFREFNTKTIGFQLYSDFEQDLMKTYLTSNQSVKPSQYPDTELYRKKKDMKTQCRDQEENFARFGRVLENLLTALRKNIMDVNGTISRDEFEKAVNDETFLSEEDRLIFLSQNVRVEDAFDELDLDDNGQASFDELIGFFERKGMKIISKLLGHERMEITDFGSFFQTLQATVLVNAKKVFSQPRDLYRTVGISTGYVGTTDFILEDADKEFLVEQGIRSTKAFLWNYIERNSLEKRVEQGNERGSNDVAS